MSSSPAQPGSLVFMSAAPCWSGATPSRVLIALVLGRLADKFGKINMHSICLIAGAVGLISLSVIDHKFGLIFCMLGVGIAWTSILSMPYAIFAPHLPENKVGVYMGIFNFFIVIPQIINGVFGGPIVSSVFQNQAIYYLIVAGVLMILGAIYVLTIKFESNK